ncbi:transcriptional regulator [Streptomyces sp. H10-C2]|uniref:telomere-associated protein Tap n=1 Tax=unclassified Streptomyces TaxID=2593676 RepID=UPI0024BA7094|nr:MULTISPECIES: transcriptional regulator [unclassified Streptomyces]MDJ0345524.1 transcriptional regulator [Streptomyces sp. PH10-H1]MDJ0374470.1 transcriptional regulator [Streptomyces sp. H10-C2]
MTTVVEQTYAAALAVLDAAEGALVAHLPNVQRSEVPSDVTDLSTAAEWALASGFGAAKLSQFGEDTGPLIVLTESAVEFLGLPARLDDRRRLRVPDDDPAIKALAESGWTLSRAGLGPWSFLFRERTEVHVAVVPWGAFDDNMRWGAVADVAADPSALAYTLGMYAERVVSPTGSTAGCSLSLMTAVRPPTVARFDRGSGRMHRVPVPGSLHKAVAPAPPEAPPEHPLAAERTREESQSPAHVLVEEALTWHREATEEEAKLPYVVGLDVNTAFLAAANRLTVGIGEAVYTDGPRFDKKVPGSWLVDLSGAPLRTKDLRTKEWRQLPETFPSPFTPDGRPPAGPAWYATPTLAYAVELGIEVRPLAAWLRPDAGGYLDLWHNRLRAAYMDTLADLGVTEDMDEEAFIASFATLKQRDPEAYALLTAIKQTAKGGIGKMREKPQGSVKREGRHAPWAALKRPTWRPDIRAAVISASRVGQHRKMVKVWNALGLVPLAVLADCVLYPSAHPTARAVMARREDGSPLPGAFRLGPNPGFVKQEGVQEMQWYRAQTAKKANPGRFIKEGRDAVRDGE